MGMFKLFGGSSPGSGGSAGRAWYPSGPRLDGKKTSYEVPVAPQPNPANFKLIDMAQVGAHLVVWLNYPGCTTFEGDKILVLYKMTTKEFLELKVMDPHFFEKNNVFARFRPTPEGWKMAKITADLMKSAIP